MLRCSTADCKRPYSCSIMIMNYEELQRSARCAEQPVQRITHQNGRSRTRRAHTHRRGTFHRRRYSLDAKKPPCFALLHPPQHKSHARVALPFQCAFSPAQVPCNSRAARPMRSATARCRTPIEEPITCQNNPSSLARASLQDKTQCFALRHPPQTQVPCIFDV